MKNFLFSEILDFTYVDSRLKACDNAHFQNYKSNTNTFQKFQKMQKYITKKIKATQF